MFLIPIPSFLCGLIHQISSSVPRTTLFSHPFRFPWPASTQGCQLNIFFCSECREMLLLLTCFYCHLKILLEWQPCVTSKIVLHLAAPITGPPYSLTSLTSPSCPPPTHPQCYCLQPCSSWPGMDTHYCHS